MRVIRVDRGLVDFDFDFVRAACERERVVLVRAACERERVVLLRAVFERDRVDFVMVLFSALRLTSLVGLWLSPASFLRASHRLLSLI